MGLDLLPYTHIPKLDTYPPNDLCSNLSLTHCSIMSLSHIFVSVHVIKCYIFIRCFGFVNFCLFSPRPSEILKKYVQNYHVSHAVSIHFSLLYIVHCELKYTYFFSFVPLVRTTFKVKRAQPCTILFPILHPIIIIEVAVFYENSIKYHFFLFFSKTIDATGCARSYTSVLSVFVRHHWFYRRRKIWNKLYLIVMVYRRNVHTVFAQKRCNQEIPPIANQDGQWTWNEQGD